MTKKFDKPMAHWTNDAVAQFTGVRSRVKMLSPRERFADRNKTSRSTNPTRGKNK